VVLGARVGLVVWVAATNGNTVPNIVAELRTKTEPPRTGSGAQRGVTHLPIARRALGSRLAGKAAICPATEEGPGSAIGLEPVPAIEGEPARVTGQVAAAPIASEAATSRAAVAETGTLSEGDRRDTADRALAATAAAVPQAWDLVGVAEEPAVAVGGADREPTVDRKS
jgi:hypothetical protein